MASQIDYQRFRRGESCVEDGCRASKFYIEDGKKFCRRGHEQTGFTQTQQDEDDWNAAGKKSRRQREETEISNSVLKGDDGRELYLQCYQLILWKQVHWLITVKGLPKELETIVRDLWGLRLGFFQKPLEGGARSGYSSGTGTAMFSSASEGEHSDTDGSGHKSVDSRKSRKSTKGDMLQQMPKLMETMGLIYLGMLLLRLPISIGEILKWVTRDEIPYNRAIKEIPRNMRSKLPSQYQNALETRVLFSGTKFRRVILSQIDFFHIEFDLVFPPLNVPLLLFKHVRDLGLPVEIYPAVQRLSKILKTDFNYPILNQTLPRTIRDPEIMLVTLIVIAAKLSQPFDDFERTPTSESDASALKMNWDEWRELMKDPPVEGLRRGEEMHVTDEAVMNMDGKEIDDYLNWFHRLWIDERGTKLPKPVVDMFPLPVITPREPVPSNLEERQSRLKQIQHSMIPQEAESEDEAARDIQRPGDKYRRYRRVDDIPEKALPFFQRAAENVGISLKQLAYRVYSAEGHLMNWNVEERRKELGEGVEADRSGLGSGDD